MSELIQLQSQQGQQDTFIREIHCISIITLKHMHAQACYSSLITHLDEHQDFCVMSYPKHSEIPSLLTVLLSM